MILDPFIKYVRNFIKNKWENILIFIIIMLFLLTLFSILGITFSENQTTKKIKKTISIEGMRDSADSDNDEDKYNVYPKHPEEIDIMCNNLTEKNCKISSDCGWLNKEKCVGGDKIGPTYHPEKQTSWQYRGSDTPEES